MSFVVSDLLWKTSRSGDSAVLDYLLNYSLFSSDILEVSLLDYSYRNTLTTVRFNEYAGSGVVGLAQIK